MAESAVIGLVGGLWLVGAGVVGSVTWVRLQYSGAIGRTELLARIAGQALAWPVTVPVLLLSARR
ncbi:hypothetical protein [Nocardia jejuensis]|uniref:hypothetical protein n=1 Tax=Nocardia jejuensis TaxID=328049 RepID=UPI000836A1AD|nr:hypothetical protein [Nocardia jejuensis]